MDKKQNCGKNKCDKGKCNRLAKYTESLIACTMKMQMAISEKLEEAKVYEEKSNEVLARAKALKCKADSILEEVEELNRRLDPLVRKVNMLMRKTIECYKEDCGVWKNCEYCCGNCTTDCGCKKNNSCHDRHKHDKDDCDGKNMWEGHDLSSFGYDDDLNDEYVKIIREDEDMKEYWNH